jgi:Zn-dependent M28 family amino/carboxypeptidase
MLRTLAALVAISLPLAAQNTGISADHIKEHTRFMSSDVFEGRGVGVRGEQITVEYLATQFALAGAKPAGEKGTYFQSVPLVGIQTQPDAQLSAEAQGKRVDFKYLDQFVGVATTQQADNHLDAEAIFVGHGIAAPEWNWDDFKGVDVKGKVLVLFTNEPTSTDPKFFDGRALTYYGRWTYKYEEAVRRGAAGAIIIHTTPTAGYGWEVVRNSWSGEDPYVKLGPNEHGLLFQGWVTREAGQQLLGLSGKTVDELLAASEKRDFKPIPLGVRIRASMPAKIRSFVTRNVAAVVPGSDPKLKDEVVIFSAHWDHLGIGTPVNGDSIYNGAIDNATGCAMILEMARAWAALPQKPKRSALFLAVTAEEGGLRGSEYYATHPLFPPSKTALALNFDAFFPYGRALDVVITGAERTTVLPQAQQVAKRLGLAITPDSEPEQGHYFRSDHFSFAQAGIPAFSVDHATEFAGKPKGWAEKAFNDYNDKHYHQPSDEFQENWDFTAVQQGAEYGFLLGIDVANQPTLPDWRPGEQFQRTKPATGTSR